jgi:transposase-like protein
LEQGTSKSALARRLGVHRDTIHRWIRDGALDRDLDGEEVRYGPRRPVATKLDAYKPIIEARLAAYPQLSAVRLLERFGRRATPVATHS